MTTQKTSKRGSATAWPRPARATRPHAASSIAGRRPARPRHAHLRDRRVGRRDAGRPPASATRSGSAIVDRRGRPRRHWNHAYPIARLHRLRRSTACRPGSSERIHRHHRSQRRLLRAGHGRGDLPLLPGGHGRDPPPIRPDFLDMTEVDDRGRQCHRHITRHRRRARWRCAGRLVDARFLESSATHTPSFGDDVTASR